MVALRVMADDAEVTLAGLGGGSTAAGSDQAVPLTDLLARSQRGDAAAFEEIYRRFVRVVHGIVVSRAGHTEAEDVTQEVFISVHRGLGAVREAQALPGWICSIARNAATDHLRRRARVPPRDPLEDVPAPTVCAESGARERVMKQVDGLPEAYRETLVLRLVEGLTGPEIAERTGLTHGSVRVNLTRGMALLRERLKSEGWP